MKKVTFLLAAVIFMLHFASAQQVAKELVVFEIFTGVNCPYCPAAANGAYDMLEAGFEVAVAAYHNPTFSISQFYTPETTARTSYYGVSGWPTTKVDGILTQSGGGNAGQSNYGAYVNLYNQRISVMSDFTIDLDWESVTDDDYEVMVTVEKVGTGTYNNLKLIVDLCESDIDYSWQGMDKLSFVTRDMIPDQNGTTLDFSGGNTIELTLPFTMPAGVVRDNCELIAFVQNFSGKEILQGTKKTMAFAEYDLDAELAQMSGIPDELCHGEIAPVIKLKNKGAEVLTSVNINFDVNGELVYTYPWTGELEFPLMETINIPAFTFNALAENEILCYLTDPNSGADQNPDNDQILKITDPTPMCTDYVVLILKTDANPQQTSYEFLDAAGNVLSAGGPFTQSYTYVKDTVYYQTPGCHQFLLYDAAGDGISTFYSVRTWVNGEITTIKSGGSFGYVDETQFTADVDGVMAAFASDVQAGCPELTVQFSDMSVGAVNEWNWEFEGGNPATSTEQNPSVFYATPGDYDVTLSVSDGTNNNTFENLNYIAVFDLPEVEFAAVGDQCVGWPGFELSGGTPEGGTYSGSGIEGGWFYPDMAGLGTHTLTYTYEDGNGCENVAEQEVLVDACTGYSELTGKQALKIYPNPVIGQSTIEFYNAEDVEVNISIYNSIGMLVKQFTPETGTGIHQVAVNTQDFENGIYFVRFSAGEETMTQKMTIVK